MVGRCDRTEPGANQGSASISFESAVSVTIMEPVTISAMCGSLRSRSLNRSVLNYAIESAPAGVSIEEVHWRDLPVYDQDLADEGMPELVLALQEQIRASDAVLFVTPEYNFSVPGGLKNAIDWLSRGRQQPFAGKPAAIMGASPGMFGTAKGQYHLRQIGVFLDLRFINKPEVMIGQAAAKVDGEGILVDETSKSFVEMQIEALVERVHTYR